MNPFSRWRWKRRALKTGPCDWPEEVWTKLERDVLRLRDLPAPSWNGMKPDVAPDDLPPTDLWDREHSNHFRIQWNITRIVTGERQLLGTECIQCGSQRPGSIEPAWVSELLNEERSRQAGYGEAE